MGKLTFLIGAGAGYVLGTRAGRARYEQIKQVAGRAWQGQGVQAQIESARRQLKQRSADVAVAASQAALHGAGQTAKNVATASFDAARGRRHPVVRGSLDDGEDVPAPPIQERPRVDAATSGTAHEPGSAT